MRSACLVVLVTMLFPAVSGGQAPTLDRQVISSAGGTVSGGPFILHFTVGQVTIGRQAGTNTEATSGFWWDVLTGSVDVVNEELPIQFALNPNVPNPFSTRTLVRYAIPVGKETAVFVGVFDLRGALVKTLVAETQAPGLHSVTWDGRAESGNVLGAGIYFIRFQTPSFTQHRRIVMLR